MISTCSELAQLQREYKAMVKNFVGERARTRDLTLHDGHYYSDCVFWLSQRPGIVAAWNYHVRLGHYFMVRCDPDQDLGLFPPKQHRPHC